MVSNYVPCRLLLFLDLMSWECYGVLLVDDD